MIDIGAALFGVARPRGHDTATMREQMIVAAVPIGPAPDLREIGDYNQTIAEQCRRSLSRFVREAWKAMRPSTPLEWSHHHDALCDHLQWLLEGWMRKQTDSTYVQPAKQMAINLPPTSLKTEIVMEFAPAWMWVRWPSWRVLCLSCNPRVALQSAVNSRRLIESAWYQGMFRPDWQLLDDQNVKSNYGNTAGGSRQSHGWSATVVGEHASCFTGETLVATEDGAIPIRTLFEMEMRPRVWSVNHATGARELKEIRAARRITNRETVTVRTLSGNMVRCTDDHQIWTPEGYTAAARLAGREVSVLRRTDGDVAREASPMQPLCVRDSDMRDVPADVRATGCRARQTDAAWSEVRPVLLDEVSAHKPARTGVDPRVCQLPDGISSGRTGCSPAMLLDEVSDRVTGPRAQGQTTARPSVCTLPLHDDGGQLSAAVLRGSLQERGALASYARHGELELSWTHEANLRRQPLGEPGAVDPRTRWESLHGVPGTGALARVAGAPCRRGSEQQSPGQPDHSLRSLSHAAPQVEADTVTSVHADLEGGRRTTDVVYDIQVEGNHNFFAGGLLVHNCLLIDDPTDPKKVTRAELQKVNEDWPSIRNRVDDERSALRFVVQQRLDVDDFTGMVTEGRGGKNWIRVVFPLEFVESRRCITPMPVDINNRYSSDPGKIVATWKDARKAEGEVLQPARLPPEVIEELKLNAGPYTWASQYQQDPRPRDGGRVKAAWIKFCRLANYDSGLNARPLGFEEAICGEAVTIPSKLRGAIQGWDLDWIWLSVDPANKKTERGSLYGLLAIGAKGARRFVLDDRSKRGEWDEILAIIRAMVRHWHPQKLLIEGTATGPTLLRALHDELASGKLRDESNVNIICAIQELTPKEVGGDKEARLDGVINQIAAGYLHVLEGAPWTQAFLEELTLFPNSPTKDRVDALTQLLAIARVSLSTAWVELFKDASATVSAISMQNAPPQEVTRGCDHQFLDGTCRKCTYDPNASKKDCTEPLPC